MTPMFGLLACVYRILASGHGNVVDTSRHVMVVVGGSLLCVNEGPSQAVIRILALLIRCKLEVSY